MEKSGQNPKIPTFFSCRLVRAQIEEEWGGEWGTPSLLVEEGDAWTTHPPSHRALLLGATNALRAKHGLKPLRPS